VQIGFKPMAICFSRRIPFAGGMGVECGISVPSGSLVGTAGGCRRLFRDVPLLAKSGMSQVVVTIHGTGRTAQNFEVPQMQAIAAQLGTMPNHRPVWWGDLIDAGACVSHNGEWLIARVLR
jgi:hypothetical protein